VSKEGAAGNIPAQVPAAAAADLDVDKILVDVADDEGVAMLDTAANIASASQLATDVSAQGGI